MSVVLKAVYPDGRGICSVVARETWAGLLISPQAEVKVLNRCDTPKFQVLVDSRDPREYVPMCVYGEGFPVRRYLLEVFNA